MENDKVGGKYQGNNCILHLKTRLLCCMSKICSWTAPLPCQQAMQMLNAQQNAMQIKTVQKIQNKTSKIYTMN